MVKLHPCKERLHVAETHTEKAIDPFTPFSTLALVVSEMRHFSFVAPALFYWFIRESHWLPRVCLQFSGSQPLLKISGIPSCTSGVTDCIVNIIMSIQTPLIRFIGIGLDGLGWALTVEPDCWNSANTQSAVALDRKIYQLLTFNLIIKWAHESVVSNYIIS